jgi:succinate dehydrogenase/fumarate reductase flavoprotein subunit
VPYRVLLPEKIDGLLAAGRCISATHVGASSGKSMGNCFATGHAAGVAAALASIKHQMPREVDVNSIQKILISDGVDLTKGGETQSKDIAN